MDTYNQTGSGLMSLTLRFGFIAIGICMAVLVAIIYLFDFERSAAVLHAKEQDHLLYHLERTSEILEHHIERLRKDALYLARRPAMQTLQARLVQAPINDHDDEQLSFLYERLEDLYHALAYSNPEYLQFRLIRLDRNGSELLRVERQKDAFVRGESRMLQNNVNRDYVRASRRLKEGEVRLSRIELSRESGENPPHEKVTLSAITPVQGFDGQPFALIVLQLDMSRVFQSMQKMIEREVMFYVVDDAGNFLHHPDKSKAMAIYRGAFYKVIQEFPELADNLANQASDEHMTFQLKREGTSVSGLAIKQPVTYSRDEQGSITYLLISPETGAISQARKESYMKVILLLAISIILIMAMTRVLTRSLRGLLKVAHAVSEGDYDVEIPQVLGKDIGHLSRALQKMTRTLKQRESQLQELNQTLELQVSLRTRQLESSRAELKHEQLLLHSILDHVGDGVIAIDRSGQALLWNRPAEEILGDCSTELPLQEWSSHFGIYPAPDAALLAAENFPLLRALKGETVRHQELFIRNKAAPEGRWISMFSRPLSGKSENSDGAVAVLVDIGDHRLLKEQLDAQSNELAKIGRLTLIGQIIDTTTHRLSQPLTAIANYIGAAIQLLRANKLDQKRLQEILELISKQADRGGVILKDLRALRARGSHTPVQLDINEVVQSAFQLLEDRLQRFQITCEWALQPVLPPIIGNNVELQQAIVHLLINAMESLATHNQPRILKISSDFQSGSDMLSIRIGDNGPGIDISDAGQIFEPWFTTKEDALGLGLAVVQNIIEDHNGIVEVMDSNDSLTWFEIELPVLNNEHN